MTAVETALRKHPDVIDVASTVVDGPPARRVVAVAAQVHCAPIDLRDHVWDTVSEPDLPDVLVVLPRLPRAEDGGQQPPRAGPLDRRPPLAFLRQAPRVALVHRLDLGV